MTRTVYPGGLYVSALPSGEYVVLYPEQRIETHLRDIPMPAGEHYGPMFLDCSRVPDFHFTGLAHDTVGRQWEWSESLDWQPIPFLTGRMAYDHFGVARDLPPAGVQFVNDANIPVSRVDTYGPFHGLSEWVETAGLYIGQGHSISGVQVWDGAVLRTLDTGYCVFIRVHRDGERVAISYHRDGAAVIVQTTLEELRALPLAEIPNPGPIPPNPGTPDPPKPPMPETPNYLPAVFHVRSKYPTPLGDTHARFLRELATTIGNGAGLLRKDTGTNIPLPDGTRVAQDIICFPDGRIFDCLQDGEDKAIPAWGEANGSPVDPSRYYAVTAGPAPIPDDDPPQPKPDYAAQIADLKVQMAGLLARVLDAQQTAVKASADASYVLGQVEGIKEALPIRLGNLKVRGTVAPKGWGYLSHTHEWNGEVYEE